MDRSTGLGRNYSGTARHRGSGEQGIDPSDHRQGDGEGAEPSSCKTNLKVRPKSGAGQQGMKSLEEKRLASLI